MQQPSPFLLMARQVREYLAVARQQGAGFDHAWSLTMSRFVSDPEWRAIFEWRREEWRRGYMRQPSRLAALSVLVPEVPALEHFGEEQTRWCGWCEKPLDEGRDPRTRYCDAHCRRLAHYHTVERTGGERAPDVRSSEGDLERHSLSLLEAAA